MLPTKPRIPRTAEQAREIMLGRRRFTETGCWEYTGVIGKNGYGMMSYEGRQQGAHRVSWQLFIGLIPKGLWVLHHCDNRPCIRPDHLFLGTAADNNADMDRKGRANRIGFTAETAGDGWRYRKGEDSPVSRLTEGEVKEIRRRYKNGERQIPLAEEFDLAQSHVSRIVRREVWDHI